MDTDRSTQALLRHLDASLGSRPEDELIAQVLGGAEPPAALLATAGRLATAVRALPDNMQHYKSLLPFREALLAWLDAAA